MGIIRRKKYSLLVPLLAFSLLTGCEGIKKRSLGYDSISNIFSLVDATLENRIIDRDNHETTFGIGYDSLFNEYTSQDYLGGTPDFDYYDEPFIQFKYAKGILQDEGSSFNFGTKYYDTLTKNVYFNFLTGEKDEYRSSNYKVTCNTVVGVDVRVNAFDQITSNVVFQNSYALNNGITFTTNRYVNFLIDYDFTAEEPTFILKVYTRNDELNAPYVGYMTYQHDFIRVVNGAIAEYRRFNIETSAAFAPDEYHTCFQDFVNDGIAFRVDSLKWYVDGAYYGNKKMPESKQLEIGATLYNLGMLEPLSYANFLSNLEDNQVTNTDSIYASVSNNYGDDIQYAFLTKNPSGISHINERNNPYYDPESMYPDLIDEIRACLSDGSKVPSYSTAGNTKISKIFTAFEDLVTSSAVYVPLYYFSKGLMKEQVSNSAITQTSLFEIYFSVCYSDGTYTNPLRLDTSYTVKQAYLAVDGQYPIDYNKLTDIYKIYVYDKTRGLYCDFELIYGESFSFLQKNTTFPIELINYGVPEYTASNVYSYELIDYYENGYGCVITRTDTSDLDNYRNRLTNNGFNAYDINGAYDYLPTYVYEKPINTYTSLFVKLSYETTTNGMTCYLLRAYHVKRSDLSHYSSSFPNELSSLGIPPYESDSAYFDLQSDGLYIYNSNYEEISYYMSQLINYYGYKSSYTSADDGYRILRKKNDTTSKYIYDLTFYYYEKENRDYFVKVEMAENPNYVETLNITSLYITSSFGSWNASAPSGVRFISDGTNYWYLENQTFLTAGTEFKFIANDDWSVCNPSSSYEGFGYDDVSSMSSMSSYFSRGNNGKIVTKVNMLLNVTCYVYSKRLYFYLDVTPIGSVLS